MPSNVEYQKKWMLLVVFRSVIALAERYSHSAGWIS